MRTPRRASVLVTVTVTAAGFMLAACGSGGGTSTGHSVRSPGAATTPVSSAPAPGSDSSGPATPHYGPAHLTGGCVLGIYDQNQNEFYQLLGLRHGSDITTGDAIAEAYQLTLANSPGSRTATVTGFTIAVYADGKKLATTSSHLPAGKLIPSGQVATFTEYPWGSSRARQGLAVGPFAAKGNPPANLAATCRLLRLDSR